MTPRLRRPAAVVALALCAAVASAEDEAGEALPGHVGVAACKSPLCHNAVTPWRGTGIRMDEYRVWRDHDAHARAYERLGGPLGQRIAARLGLGSARRAPQCLACHADSVAPARWGRGFAIEDGVGCEACHGGAERWLTTHAAGPSHADNLARGMYPTDVVARRAELCLSCHMGSRERFVTHRMLAAGHPRLAFELDTYTRTEPAHYRVTDAYRGATDAYRARKSAPTSAQTWAVGQVVALRRHLELVVARWSEQEGPWPEFALVRCEQCHHDAGTHPLGLQGGRAPHVGLPRPGDPAFLLAATVLCLAAPGRAPAIEQALAAVVESATGRSADTASRATAARDLVSEALEAVTAWEPDDASLRALLVGLSGGQALPEPLTHPAAAQVVMAVQALLGSLGDDTGVLRSPAVQALLAATQRPADFDAASFRSALAQVATDTTPTGGGHGSRPAAVRVPGRIGP